MDIVSCNNCGVLFDKNKLVFPDGIDNYDDDELCNYFELDDNKYIAIAKCPVCQGRIPESGSK